MNSTYDVAVIGGGSAGICAAIAAARRGSKTALVERATRLGGMGTRALVHTFCGLYEPDPASPPVLANPGLPTEIERAMRQRTGQDDPDLMGRLYVLRQDPAMFARLANDLTAAEENLTVLFDADCQEIVRRPSFNLVTSKGEICATALVDTSANATVAALLGATRTKAKVLQKSAYIFALQKVAAGAFEESFKMQLALDLVRAVQAGILPPEVLGTATRASTIPGELYLTIDLDEVTEGPALAKNLVKHLREKFAFFSKCPAPVFPEVPGVRESWRWLGEYVLTGNDLISGRSFDDVVARAAWPIELRESTRGPRFQDFEHARSSDIPLRALTSAEVPGVYFAGRCLSATHEALASVRVMGTCFATGQAAGLAASLFADGKKPTRESVFGEIENL